MSKEAQKPVRIIDSTLREGAASPLMAVSKKIFWRTEDKLDIADALIKYGIWGIEVFSPIVTKDSGKEEYDLRALIEKRDQMVSEGYPKVYILVHARCDVQDVEAALKIQGVDGFNFYIGTSSYSRNNHGKEMNEVTTMAINIASYVRQIDSGLVLRISGEDASRTKKDILEKFFRKVAPYANRLGIPDTTGEATPGQVRRMLRDLGSIKEEFDIEWELHFHHDRERSLINALAAIKAGALYINTSIGGLGERTGITNLTSLARALHKSEKNLVRNLNIGLSREVDEVVSEKLGMNVDPRASVNDANATHIGGPHIKAIQNDPNSYQNSDIEEFGVERRVVLSPLIGWNGVGYFVKENYGICLDAHELKSLTQEFKGGLYSKAEQGYSLEQYLKELMVKRGYIKVEPTVVFSASNS